MKLSIIVVGMLMSTTLLAQHKNEFYNKGAEVTVGQTQYIQGSYAVRGDQAAIGVNDSSFYDLELANDQRIVWLNGTGNIADVRNLVDFSGKGVPVVNRIVTHDPSAIPVDGSGYAATFGLMNPAPGLAGMIDNSTNIGGNICNRYRIYLRRFPKSYSSGRRNV